MKFLKSTVTLVCVAVMGIVPSVAFAHPGHFHAMTLTAGLLHPLTGLDHVLAMTAVGLWASQQGGRALWAWPVTFVSIMLVGGILGLNGVTLPLIEPAIAASVLVLGLLVAGAAVAPIWAGALLVGLFALFHGNAHGLEAPASGATALYALGFVCSTAVLHGAGIALGLSLRDERWQTLVRIGGALTASVGGILFFV